MRSFNKPICTVQVLWQFSLTGFTFSTNWLHIGHTPKVDLDLLPAVQSIGMDTNCAPLVADVFLFRYERDFMLTLSRDEDDEIIEAFNSTFRYLDDLLNIILIMSILTVWSIKFTHQNFS